MNGEGHAGGDPRLRPATARDDDLMGALFADARSDQVGALGLDADSGAAFLGMQRRAQQRHYRVAFPHAVDSVVEIDGEAAGRVLLAEADGELRLVDVALLPAHRGRGVGTTLLKSLQELASCARVPLRLSAARDGRARRLYERLGFSPTADDGVHVAMEWHPAENGERI